VKEVAGKLTGDAKLEAEAMQTKPKARFATRWAVSKPL